MSFLQQFPRVHLDFGAVRVLPAELAACGISRPLLITTTLVVAVGALLPFTSLAGPLGFVPLTGTFYVFVAAATLVYLLLVQLAKVVLLGHAERWRASRMRRHLEPAAR